MKFDFPETLENLETVPENLRECYLNNGSDGYIINPDHKGIVETCRGAFKSLNVARAEAQGLRGKSSILAELQNRFGGESLDDIMENINKEIDVAKTKTYKDAEGKVVANFESLLKKERDKVESLEQRYATRVLDSDFTHHLLEAGAVSATVSDLRYLANQQIESKFIDGELDINIKNSDGETLYSQNGGSGRMGLKEFAKLLSQNKRFGSYFQSQCPSGDDVHPNSIRRARTTNVPMSATDKIAQGLKKQLHQMTK